MSDDLRAQADEIGGKVGFFPDDPRTRFILQGLRAAVKSEREKVAHWMMTNGFATGHGDTIEDLLSELGGQLKRKP
jgi:hypothetical protein